MCLNLAENFGIEAAQKVSRDRGIYIVLLPMLAALTVLNSAPDYTPGLQKALCLVSVCCHLSYLLFQQAQSLISTGLNISLSIVRAVRKFLSLPVRLAFRKLYLNLLSPPCISPFSHSAYLILPLDSFLIHSREV